MLYRNCSRQRRRVRFRIVTGFVCRRLGQLQGIWAQGLHWAGNATTKEAYRVYEMFTRSLCHATASASEQWPRIDAATDAAAATPPVIARCTPDEKNGSMKAAIEKVMTDEKFWHH